MKYSTRFKTAAAQATPVAGLTPITFGFLASMLQAQVHRSSRLCVWTAMTGLCSARTGSFELSQCSGEKAQPHQLPESDATADAATHGLPQPHNLYCCAKIKLHVVRYCLPHASSWCAVHFSYAITVPATHFPKGPGPLLPKACRQTALSSQLCMRYGIYRYTDSLPA